MSADNGIYCLETYSPRIKEGNSYLINPQTTEYRIAHCQSIDDIDFSDLYLPVKFGESPVYKSKAEAMAAAHELAKEYDFLEYGVCFISIPKDFPNMTARAAAKALDNYVGATPLDYFGEPPGAIAPFESIVEKVFLKDSLSEIKKIALEARIKEIRDEYDET